jgi:hypothetical protein
MIRGGEGEIGGWADSNEFVAAIGIAGMSVAFTLGIGIARVPEI